MDLKASSKQPWQTSHQCFSRWRSTVITIIINMQRILMSFKYLPEPQVINMEAISYDVKRS